MTEEQNKNELEDYIPPKCRGEIASAAKKSGHRCPVYRVAKWGIIEERAFMSTYEEIMEGIIPDHPERYPRDKAGTYSTSVYTDRKNCDKFIKLLGGKVRLREKYPHPVVLEGKTSLGIAQRTEDRDPDYTDDTHVDWWIYKGRKKAVMADFKIV